MVDLNYARHVEIGIRTLREPHHKQQAELHGIEKQYVT